MKIGKRTLRKEDLNENLVSFLTEHDALHKFLNNIRDDYVWEKTKFVVAPFSSVSIGIIEDISNRLILKIIDESLHLNP